MDHLFKTISIRNKEIESGKDSARGILLQQSSDARKLKY